MNEQHILDFYALGSAFAGVVVIIAVAAALSRTSLSRVAYWLVAVAEVCLLLGAVTFNVFIWRAVVESTGILWWEVVGLVLIAAGMVSGVVGLIALMRELALRRAIGWLALCAVALLVLVGANSALSGSTLLQIFDLPFLREMLRSRPKQHAYYGVVSALLVCALLPALAYFLRSGRPHGTAAAVARAGE